MINRLIVVSGYFVRFAYARIFSGQKESMDILYQAVKELGGVYVKLIQFICLRTEVFSKKDKIRFLSFYDQVPPVKIDVTDFIRKELGTQKLNCFTSISEEPFASGTFGQVYKGRFTDSASVVIKIKRPGILPQLRSDFLVLTVLSKLFSLFYYQRIVNIPALIREFKALTYKELDYLTEAENAEYFRRLYANHPQIFIPQTYRNLCTKNILVQEFVGGVSVTELIRMKNETSYKEYRTFLKNNYQTDVHTVLRSLAYELALQGLLYDYFYADPHPGNIRILPDNRYAIIDFGIVGISPVNKRSYYDIISLIVKHAEQLDMRGIGKEFLKWGAGDFYECIKVLDEYFRKAGDTKLADLITEKYQDMLESKRERFRQIEHEEQENFAKMYLDIIKTGQNLQVKVPDGLLAMLKTVAVYKSWNEFLEPDLHHMRDTYSAVLSQVDRNTLVNLDEVGKKRISPEEAIEKIFDWIGSVAESDFSFFSRIQSELKGVGYV